MSNPETKKALKNMYNNSLKASYFNNMETNKYTAKSNLQLQEMVKEEANNIDEKTFRLQPNFRPAQQPAQFQVQRKSGKFYFDTSSFWSCIVQRARYDLQLINTKLRVTRGNEVIYYFDFNVISANISFDNSSFTIQVEGCDKTFYFEPIREQKEWTLREWRQVLEKAIKNSEGKIKGFTYLPHSIKDFYQFLYTSNQDFEEKANNGDILLFKSDHSAASVQRFFTNSEYDHVGVVLRNKKNELYIYESTSTMGVGMTSWRHMIKYEWYKSATKIVWRKLKMDVTAEDIDRIETFVAKTLNKSFSVTISKLFVLQSKFDREEEEEEGKTYFCSQLVARLYKEMGLIDRQIASSRYYPVDFSQRSKLKFIQSGVTLGPQMILAFNV